MDELTRAEREVFEYLRDPRGLTYKEIGERMGKSWRTVRWQAHMIYEKFGIGGAGARVRLTDPSLGPSPSQAMGREEGK